LSGQCSPALEGRSGYSKLFRTVADGDAVNRFELFNWHRFRWTLEALPLRPSTLQSRDGPFLQSFAFELAQGLWRAAVIWTRASAGCPTIRSALIGSGDIIGRGTVAFGKMRVHFNGPYNRFRGP
jgi:hypothetical protein